MVDVDSPAFQRAAKVVGQYLHVPGEYDQVDVVLVHQFQQAPLGVCLGLGGHREVDEGEAGGLGHGPVGFMVGNHKGDVAAQASARASGKSGRSGSGRTWTP